MNDFDLSSRKKNQKERNGFGLSCRIAFKMMRRRSTQEAI